MDNHLSSVGLSYVGEAGAGCSIYRETSGRYVVSQGDRLQEGRRVATLACAYATCRELRSSAGTAGLHAPTPGSSADVDLR